MRRDLLIEIGTEEIPASYLAPASSEFKSKIEKFLQDSRIDFKESKIFYTPRRIAILIFDVLSKQPDEIKEIQGPPRDIGYDKNGKPTKTGYGFARSHKKSIKDVYIKSTPKGEYLFLKKRLRGENTTLLLKKTLPKLILSLSFPKSMRWTETKLRFARPIRWIVVLFGNTPVKIQINKISTSPYTFGHRFLSKKPLKIKEPREYESLLQKHYCIADPERRREMVDDGLINVANSIRARVVEDPELLEEVTNTVEYPLPILCQFEERFLQLPEEVLITALKYHQRCFALKDREDRLIPYFIAITNAPKGDKSEIRKWYERFLKSRLADAEFYYKKDIEKGLEKRVEEEKRVIWIEGLGTLYDKTQRLVELSSFLSSEISGVDEKALKRAAYLSKADLLTNMIREKEFTSLQGIMGGIYARVLGEPDKIGEIIYEHYLPKSSQDQLPKTLEGSILSMVDKLDNITASFLKGEIPTGSEDPFGLRRQATAIIYIILERNLFLSLDRLVEKSLELYNKKDNRVKKNLREFFEDRVYQYLIEKGIRYDIANGVKLWFDNPLDAKLRADALMDFRKDEEFERLVIGQKRVANILKGIRVKGGIDPSLFKAKEERALYEKAKEIERLLKKKVKERNYKASLETLLSLRGEIDALFDEVLVMTEEEDLRNNRLALLSYIKSLFLEVCDLSEIVLEGEE